MSGSNSAPNTRQVNGKTQTKNNNAVNAQDISCPITLASKNDIPEQYQFPKRSACYNARALGQWVFLSSRPTDGIPKFPDRQHISLEERKILLTQYLLSLEKQDTNNSNAKREKEQTKQKLFNL